MNFFDRITECLLRNKLLSAALAPWFTYALKHFYITITGGMLLLLLRRYIGGWHASSPVRCLILSSFCEIAYLILLYPLLARVPIVASFILSLTAFVLVHIFAPLPPRNLHETGKQRDEMKKLSRRTVCLETLVVIILFAFHLHDLALYVSLGMGCAAFSLMIARLLQKNKMEESFDE